MRRDGGRCTLICLFCKEEFLIIGMNIGKHAPATYSSFRGARSADAADGLSMLKLLQKRKRRVREGLNDRHSGRASEPRIPWPTCVEWLTENGIIHSISLPSAAQFLEPIQQICPTGKSLQSLSSSSRKNIVVHFRPKSLLHLFRPALTRGVSRSSRTLRRDAMDAGFVKRRMTLRADGEAVWS